MAERKIVQAVTPFMAPNSDGTPWQVRPGQLYYSDDPIVTGRESMFREPEVQDSTNATRTPRRRWQYPAPEEAIAPPAGPVRRAVTKKGAALEEGRPAKTAAAHAERPDGEV